MGAGGICPDALSSHQFGIQGALDAPSGDQWVPDLPVVMIDTSYLFPETYGFVDQLGEKALAQPPCLSSQGVRGLAGGAYGPSVEQGLEGSSAITGSIR